MGLTIVTTVKVVSVAPHSSFILDCVMHTSKKNKVRPLALLRIHYHIGFGLYL